MTTQTTRRLYRTKIAAVGLAAAIGIGAGVAAFAGGNDTPTARTPTAEAATADATSNGSIRTAGAVPDPLNTIEAQAEDIIDLVPADRWEGVATDVQTVRDNWSIYREQALNDGAARDLAARFDQALNDLQAAAKARQPAETMQAANDLSAAAVELFGLYDTTHPVDIGRLDVIGRQIVLDADRQDLKAAGVQVDRALGIWDGGLRADIVGRQGQTVADQTDATLAGLQTAKANKDFATLTTQAKVLLEVVDAMEGLY